MKWQGKVAEISEFLRKLKSGQNVTLFTEDEANPDSKPSEKKTPQQHQQSQKQSQQMTQEEIDQIIEDLKKEEPQYDLKQELDEANDRWFAQKIQSVLKDNAMKRLIPGRKFGELNHKRLHKIKLSDRLFLRPDSIMGKKYSIVLLIDCSGSMHSARIQQAANCVYKLVPILEKYAQVAVLGFSEKIKTYKTLQQKLDLEAFHKEIIADVEHQREGLGQGTHDHAGMRESRKLLAREKGRKVIITLSDGSPGCPHSSGGCQGAEDCGSIETLSEKLKQEIFIAKSNKIHTIGIGIYSSVVELFYEQFVIVSNLKELYDGIIKELNKIVWRGI